MKKKKIDPEKISASTFAQSINYEEANDPELFNHRNKGSDKALLLNDEPRKDIDYNQNFYHPYLPIVSPDYSYVMDLIDMGTFLVQKYDTAHGTQLKRKEVDHHNKGYKYLLAIIDTTSRKVWLYPVHGKDQYEIYRNFKKFLFDVGGKIARLLSDNDTAFTQIIKNNDSFSYCIVTAAENNHTVLSMIDTFCRTFRNMMYRFLKEHTTKKVYSWYDAYPTVLNTYNNTKHGGLYLYNEDGTRKIHYTPNQAWINPRLRSRIRLRHYLDGMSAYGDPDGDINQINTMYQRLCRAKYVRVRLKKDAYTKGNDHFSTRIYKKGNKFGNSWEVEDEHKDKKLISYRNLIPADNYEDPSARIAKAKHSKYRFGKSIWKRIMNLDNLDLGTIERRNDKNTKNKAVASSRARLRKSREARDLIHGIIQSLGKDRKDYNAFDKIVNSKRIRKPKDIYSDSDE